MDEPSFADRQNIQVNLGPRTAWAKFATVVVGIGAISLMLNIGRWLKPLGGERHLVWPFALIGVLVVACGIMYWLLGFAYPEESE